MAITHAEIEFANWCKVACKIGKGCKYRKKAKADTTWLELKATCKELQKINKWLV